MMDQVDELKQIAARLGSLRRSLQAMGNLEEFSEVRQWADLCSDCSMSPPAAHCTCCRLAAKTLKSYEDRLEKVKDEVAASASDNF
eukprot:763458-Hanusia_phi.AAC.3